MVLVVTDTGSIWNHLNPVVNQYKDALLVFCLNGKKVTEQNKCLVLPYEERKGAIETYGFEDPRFKALASVAGDLPQILGYHDDIVFLTDTEPSTLYPFYVLKDLIKHARIHLLAMSPLAFETNAKIKAHAELLADLSNLDSFLYYDINEKLKTFDKEKTIDAFLDDVRDDLARMTPCILNGIHHMKENPSMKEEPCYFDFTSKEYVPLRKGFRKNKITIEKLFSKFRASKVDFKVAKSGIELGLLIPPNYPSDGKSVKSEIEKPESRINGKKICNMLREQRIRLAAANNISFASAECPSLGACAGTCVKCEIEANYLREQLQKIPEEKRVYPQFDPIEETTL